ncbi:transforming growth factor-beta-induced protein ig-h3-like [Mya arenaria]|uniref:transforming growth factor-beta-induced protein ig-h3-like n=1 Tax=Mya arenaria TaxID=6604 RepID=UPI0022E6EC86|nr:transforming growth factor-beta-induced protein ig-h3-like [Mya arenaria]
MHLAYFLCVMVGPAFGALTVDILAHDSRFTTLVDLVVKAGLVNTLNTGTYTIFAPTNDAFNALPPATLSGLANDVNALTNVLKYHVVQNKIMKSSASNELTIATLNGQKVRFNIYSHNNKVTVQGSEVIEFDKVASNGVIHVLNNVMLPPEGDIVDIVAKTSDVSTLLSLVQQAGIASALKGDALTVFAPTNAAFARLPSSVVNKITSNTGLLTEILEYHVVPHTEYSPGLYNREFLRTLDRNHDIIQLHTDSTGVRVNRNGHVTKANIGTTNGVIHLIDHVLIPARYYLTLLVGPAFGALTVDILTHDSRFTTLVDLVVKAGLVNTLNTGTYTIFAPTNDAFNALPPATLSGLANDVNALTNVLKYHVVQNKIMKSSASNELTIATLNGQKVRFNIYSHNNKVTVQGSEVIEFDKVASNGVIHVLNNVMLPPEGDIVDIVTKTSNVSTLLSLVQQAGIASALQGDALTVFAPTNAAFARLPKTVVNKLTSNTGLLTEILEYHVVPHTEYSPGLYNREFLRTLDRNHDIIQLHTDSTGVRVNRNGHVTKANIGTTNGVIHLIDHVLIPARYYLTLLVGKK